MNTYNNNRKTITENDIIEIESWLMNAHRDFNKETLTKSQLNILLKFINLIKPDSKPKIKKK